MRFLLISRISVVLLLIIAGTLVSAETPQAPEAQLGIIVGTVLDVNNDTVPGATVVLQGPDPSERRTVIANDNGFFDLHDVKPGISYHIMVSAKGFSDWTSPAVVVEPNHAKILTGCHLQLETVHSAVTVYASDKLATEQLALEQVQVELNQRVFGIIPNFYVAYDLNAVPLTPKLEFKLAMKAATDPVTAMGIGVLAAANQAADRPNYKQGWDGFGRRFGASAADGFSSIMIGGAILPSLLHQDPRYFYQGTGSTKSRTLHALAHPFICKGDNGLWQPNYSTLAGDLASSAISSAYYPASNRGTGFVFSGFAISTAARAVSGLGQEFVLGRFTHKGKLSQ